MQKPNLLNNPEYDFRSFLFYILRVSPSGHHSPVRGAQGIKKTIIYIFSLPVCLNVVDIDIINLLPMIKYSYEAVTRNII